MTREVTNPLNRKECSTASQMLTCNFLAKKRMIWNPVVCFSECLLMQLFSVRKPVSKLCHFLSKYNARQKCWTSHWLPNVGTLLISWWKSKVGRSTPPQQYPQLLFEPLLGLFSNFWVGDQNDSPKMDPKYWVPKCLVKGAADAYATQNEARSSPIQVFNMILKSTRYST